MPTGVCAGRHLPRMPRAWRHGTTGRANYLCPARIYPGIFMKFQWPQRPRVKKVLFSPSPKPGNLFPSLPRTSRGRSRHNVAHLVHLPYEWPHLPCRHVGVHQLDEKINYSFSIGFMQVNTFSFDYVKRIEAGLFSSCKQGVFELS